MRAPVVEGAKHRRRRTGRAGGRLHRDRTTGGGKYESRMGRRGGGKRRGDERDRDQWRLLHGVPFSRLLNPESFQRCHRHRTKPSCVIRDTAPGGIADVQMELALRSAARSRRDNKRTWQLPSSTHLISGTERRRRWERTLRAAREQADEIGPDGPMSQTFSLHQAQLRTHLPHSLSRRVPARLNPFHYNLPSLAPSCQLHNSHKRRI